MRRPFWRRHCAHSDLFPIFGDAINQARGYRLICRTCNRYIDGPVTLAAARANERRGYVPPPTVGPRGGAGDSGAWRR